jgi:hypothetical protein
MLVDHGAGGVPLANRASRSHGLPGCRLNRLESSRNKRVSVTPAEHDFGRFLGVCDQPADVSKCSVICRVKHRFPTELQTCQILFRAWVVFALGDGTASSPDSLTLPRGMG